MQLARTRRPTLALSTLILASLACQALLAPEEFFGEEPSATRAQSLPATATNIAPNTANPTELPPTPAPPSTRLSGTDLPTLDFGPPGESPSSPNRPALSGPRVTLDTEHFRIHYTLEGADAVPNTDSDGNGHPDYVEEVAVALEYSWFAQIEHFGWAAPPADEGLGGDDRYDVYLENLLVDGTAGYTDGGFEDTIIGDNPNSPVVENAASHSYMALDNDFAESDDFAINGISGMQFMRSTAAHEFLHAIQFGYDARERHEWLWEASATWIQDEVLDSQNDSIEDLYSVFKSPDSCLLSYGGEERVEDANHWYGLWIFFRYFSERYGHSAVVNVWETAATLDGYEIWDQILAQRGTNLEAFFRSYATALLLRDFQEGADYPLVRLEGEAALGATFTPTDGVGQLAADYLRINASGPTTLMLVGDGLEGHAIGIAPDGQSHHFPLHNGIVSLPADSYDEVYLIVLNLQRAATESDCEFAPYSLMVGSGGSPSLPSEVRPAPNFSSPSVEGLGDPGELYQNGGGSAEPPGDLALSYVPDGYEFYSAYELAREEFHDQENIDYYVPGAGPVTVLDYYGPGESDIVSLYVSDSPYGSLDAFLDEAGEPAVTFSQQQLFGIEVLFEDYSAPEGPFSTATFIVGSDFYVIEGPISLEELEQVVAAWLSS